MMPSGGNHLVSAGRNKFLSAIGGKVLEQIFSLGCVVV